MSLGGEDHSLTHGAYTAAVTQVGAGLRLLQHQGRDLVRSYAADQVRPVYRGALLVPWPNRVVDGSYSFAGQDLQLDVSEPERGHAIHGLVAWTRFTTVERDASSVLLRHAIVPRTGYPFSIEVTAGYRLHDDGLTCTVEARNTGDREAPYGVGAHPYLLGGTGRVDDWILEVPADDVQLVTTDRLVPTGVSSVTDAGFDFDFRRARQVGGVELDHAFTALTADPDGRVRARVTAPDGRGAEIEWDPVVQPWVQVHTADLPDPAETRRGLAVEPMSCPPDAFGSGTDLAVLQPGDRHVAAWTLRAV